MSFASGKAMRAALSCVNFGLFRAAREAKLTARPNQYFDLIAYVRPIVNWKELRFVGGSELGGLFR